MGILPELSMSCSSASGPRFAVVLVSDWCVECWKLCAPCQDTAFQKPLFPPAALTCLSDHIATTVIPSQFACKETVFKGKNKLHFTIPLVRTDMLVYPRSKVMHPRHFCSEDQSSVSTPAARNWSALLLCAPGRKVPGLRSGGVVGAQGCA